MRTHSGLFPHAMVLALLVSAATSAEGLPSLATGIAAFLMLVSWPDREGGSMSREPRRAVAAHNRDPGGSTPPPAPTRPRRDSETVRFPVTPRPKVQGGWRSSNAAAKKRWLGYRDDIRKLAGRWRPRSGVVLTFRIPMPKSWTKKKREMMVHTDHKQTPDICNLIDGFLDCWSEDKHIARVVGTKVWTDDPIGSVEATNR